MKNLTTRMRRLRSDMAKTKAEQKTIKEGQRLVRKKFEAIELECEQLRKETKLIMQQSANTQLRLAFMFGILKARENREFDKAAKLTCILRYLSPFATWLIEVLIIFTKYFLKVANNNAITNHFPFF
ncbi:MAG: hypothetical protein Q8807_03155 ['Waltheria sp.' little leaf phytoplasma]|nr:hypothetical protein ['Waltheria sp.' little leaf phytoplasma]